MPEDVQVSEAQQTQEPSGESGSQQAFDHKLGESGTRENGADSKGNGERPAANKPLSRYERVKRDRAAIRQRDAAFQAERAALQREREAFTRERAEAAKPKRDYSLAELQKYRGQWEREGNFELVEAADKEIAVMQAEAAAERQARTVEMPPLGSPEHRAQWESAERELAQADPEFMRAGTRLDTRLREIMAGPNGDIYRQHSRGIVAAYHRAKMELLEVDMKGLQTENSKLKTELQRYTGLTSIGGGAPARIGSSPQVESLKDFERLSTKDMRKYLLSKSNRQGVPWF